MGGGSRGWTHHPSLCPLEQQRGRRAGANPQGQAPSAHPKGGNREAQPGLWAAASWRDAPSLPLLGSEPGRCFGVLSPKSPSARLPLPLPGCIPNSWGTVSRAPVARGRLVSEEEKTTSHWEERGRWSSPRTALCSKPLSPLNDCSALNSCPWPPAVPKPGRVTSCPKPRE